MNGVWTIRHSRSTVSQTCFLVFSTDCLELAATLYSSHL